jgi:hypothetical protein
MFPRTSKPSPSAASSSSPLSSVDQPRSYAVEMSYSSNAPRRGTGVPWSNSRRTQTGASALRAACSSTARACSGVTPGNHSTNWATRVPSSRFSNSAAPGTRVPRNTQAPPTRSGSRPTAGQVDQSITTLMLAPPPWARPELARGSGYHQLLHPRQRPGDKRSPGLVFTRSLIRRSRVRSGRPPSRSPCSR